MNKQQVIETLAEKTEQSRATISRVLDGLNGLVTDALNNGHEVTLHGLGKLKPTHKEARQGRNPQTGEAITIDARYGVKFTPSKALKDSLN